MFSNDKIADITGGHMHAKLWFAAKRTNIYMHSYLTPDSVSYGVSHWFKGIENMR